MNNMPEEEQPKEEGELKDGFTFILTEAEMRQIGGKDYQAGDSCKFLISTIVTKNDKGVETHQATEIEKVGVDEPTRTDLMGASPLYKAANGYPQAKPKPVQYVRPTIEPYVS